MILGMGRFALQTQPQTFDFKIIFLKWRRNFWTINPFALLWQAHSFKLQILNYQYFPVKCVTRRHSKLCSFTIESFFENSVSNYCHLPVTSVLSVCLTDILNFRGRWLLTCLWEDQKIEENFRLQLTAVIPVQHGIKIQRPELLWQPESS